MIDFTELPKDGVKFEQLIRELLLREDYVPRWTGVGPDGGRDIIFSEKTVGPLSSLDRKWVVSCKHKANGGGSVSADDIQYAVGTCQAIGATGFILACSTQASSAAVTRLSEIEKNQGITCLVWDGVEIEKRLMAPRCAPLVHLFFPQTAKLIPWAVFNAGTPSLWCISFHGYFFYLSSRLPAGVPNLLYVQAIVEKLETVPLSQNLDQFGQRERLRLRGMYYDDKNCNFLVFVDYLVPTAHGEKNVLQQSLNADEVLTALDDGNGFDIDGEYNGQPVSWDVMRIKTSQLSDHFDEDHRDYYAAAMPNISSGLYRDGASSGYSYDKSSWR